MSKQQMSQDRGLGVYFEAPVFILFHRMPVSIQDIYNSHFVLEFGTCGS